MSRIALLLAAAIPAGTTALVGADQAMERYRAMTAAAGSAGRETFCGSDGTDIVVCAHRGRPDADRLPLRDDRTEEGEIVRHRGETSSIAALDPGPRCSRPGSCEPPKTLETLTVIMGWITGTDPPPPPH